MVVPLTHDAAWALFFGRGQGGVVALSDAEAGPSGEARYLVVSGDSPFASAHGEGGSVPPVRSVTRVLESPLGGMYEITLEPAANGTRVTHRWDVVPANAVLRVLLPVLSPLLRRAQQRDLDRIARRAGRGRRRGGP